MLCTCAKLTTRCVRSWRRASGAMCGASSRRFPTHSRTTRRAKWSGSASTTCEASSTRPNTSRRTTWPAACSGRSIRTTSPAPTAIRDNFLSSALSAFTSTRTPRPFCPRPKPSGSWIESQQWRLWAVRRARTRSCCLRLKATSSSATTTPLNNLDLKPASSVRITYSVWFRTTVKPLSWNIF